MRVIPRSIKILLLLAVILLVVVTSSSAQVESDGRVPQSEHLRVPGASESVEMRSNAAQVDSDQADISDWFTVVGLFLAVLALFYTATQVKMSQRIAKSEFLLKIWELTQGFNCVHKKLTGDGVWSSPDVGPSTDEDWSQVLRYAGLFEAIQILIDDKIIEVSVVDRLFSHRILALMSNDAIRAHLTSKSYRWQDFLQLWNLLQTQATYKAIKDKELVKASRVPIGDAAPNPRPQADV